MSRIMKHCSSPEIPEGEGPGAQLYSAEFLRPRAPPFSDVAIVDKMQDLRNEMQEEKAKQARALDLVESRLGEDMRTCKEAIAVEVALCEEMEVRLEKKFRGLIEDEAAVRRAVECHLEARVVALRAEISSLVQSELQGYLKKELVPLKSGIDEAIRSAIETAIPACAFQTGSASSSSLGSDDDEDDETVGPLNRKVPKRSRSPKKKPLVVMQPLQEQPDREHLEKLEEAMEREMKSRVEIERRLEAAESFAGKRLEALLQHQRALARSLAAASDLFGEDGPELGGAAAECCRRAEELFQSTAELVQGYATSTEQELALPVQAVWPAMESKLQEAPVKDRDPSAKGNRRFVGESELREAMRMDMMKSGSHRTLTSPNSMAKDVEERPGNYLDVVASKGGLDPGDVGMCKSSG